MKKLRTLFSLRKPPACAAGLDLNEQGLRWVQLCENRAGGKAHTLLLERCVFEPLAPGCVVSGQIIDFGEVEAALGRLLAQVRAGPDAPPVATLALGIPDSLITTQRLRVAAPLSEAERLAQVQLEMAALLRSDSADLCVDFEPSQDGGTMSAELTLMAVAAPRVAVEDRIALLEAAGMSLPPAVMAVASQAAVHAADRVMQARGLSAQAVIALIQLESSALRLDLIRQGQVLHSLPVEVPTPLFALEGVDVLNVLDVLDLPAGLLQAIEDGGAEQIWVAGPAEQADVWAATLRNRTTLPCAMLDAFDAMVPADLSAELQAFRLNDGPESLVACGLALTALRALPSRKFGSHKRVADQLSFNFLPHRETAWAQRKSSFYKQVGAVALVVLLTSAAARHILSAHVQNRRDVVAESTMAIAKVEAELKRMATVGADRSSLERQADLLTFMQAPHQMPLLLEELRALLPDGLRLTGLRRDAQGDAVLSGQANSAAEVFALIERLTAHSKHFKRPALLDLSLLQTLPVMPASPASHGLNALGDINVPGGEGTERVVFSLQAYSR